MDNAEKETILINSLLKEETESMIVKNTLCGYLKGHGVKDSIVNRVSGCCNKLVFATDDALTNKKEIFAITCKNRYCNNCQKRESYSRFYNLLTASTLLTKKNNYELFFVTLTVVNVRGEFLRECLDSINRSIHDLMKLSPFTFFKDYSIKVEITHNEIMDTYHPHVHALFFADKKKSFKLGKKKVLELWNRVYQKNCRFYKKITQIDVQKVKKADFESSLLEVSKYAVKSNDFAKSFKTFKIFYEALYKKQLFRVNGEIGALYRAIDFLKKEKDFKSFFDSLLGKEVDETYYNRLFESRFSFKKEAYSTSELGEESPFYKVLDDLNKKIVVEINEVITLLTEKIGQLKREISSLIAKDFNCFDDNKKLNYAKEKRKKEKKAADYAVLLDFLVALKDKKKQKKK